MTKPKKYYEKAGGYRFSPFLGDSSTGGNNMERTSLIPASTPSKIQMTNVIGGIYDSPIHGKSLSGITGIRT